MHLGEKTGGKRGLFGARDYYKGGEKVMNWGEKNMQTEKKTAVVSGECPG